MANLLDNIPPAEHFNEGDMYIILKFKGKLYAVKQKFKDKKLAGRTKSIVEANQRRFLGEYFINR